MMNILFQYSIKSFFLGYEENWIWLMNVRFAAKAEGHELEVSEIIKANAKNLNCYTCAWDAYCLFQIL